MPVTILDLIVLGVVFVSALLAAIRGFTREVLAIGSWIVAALAALYLHPQVIPLLREYLPASIGANATAVLAIAIAAVFLVTLVVVSFITVKISDMILDSRIGALDRSLGFLFGAARGLLICVIAFTLFVALVSPKAQPEWVRQAKAKPLLEATGDQLIAMLPADPIGMIEKLRKRPRDGDAELPAEPALPAPPADAGRRTEAPSGGRAEGAAVVRTIDRTPPRPATPTPTPR